jgi:hypothetical protein
MDGCASERMLGLRQSFAFCPFEALSMKFLGFLLLLAGWLIVLTAILLLPSMTARASFVIAGILVEILGFGVVVRAHLFSPGEIR